MTYEEYINYRDELYESIVGSLGLPEHKLAATRAIDQLVVDMHDKDSYMALLQLRESTGGDDE